MKGQGFALVGGGARSGKSTFALGLAMNTGPRRVFIATAVAFDEEMRVRIELHRKERGRDFETLEAPTHLDTALAQLATERADVDVVVIDCLTLWLSNLLLAEQSHGEIEARVNALTETLTKAPFRGVVVTNEVGMGLVPETPLGRAFRDVAGRAHQRLARSASNVYLAAIGTIVRLRPGPVAVVEDAIERNPT
jgi:adenosylcobinamide kinase/adenosylcobinamide-phosphate guanylyltransferase